MPYSGKTGRALGIAIICIWATGIFMTGGCGYYESYRAQSSYEEAGQLFTQGRYQASLTKYEQLKEEYPAHGDRALFEMAIILAHPRNEERNYQKSLRCLEEILLTYAGSGYRHDSLMMTFYINNVIQKDELTAAQQRRIKELQEELKERDQLVLSLRSEMGRLEKKVFAFVLQRGSADRVLVEKKERRLTLISHGEVLKSYRVALGGNPVGPKERLDDNKTPEGAYIIDAKNKDSRYHLSLHISYPNEMDRRRAKESGLDPGGNIMIHGLKNGFSWVGDFHTANDWTEGCIAVTDEEIEEIDKLAPIGTPVEIRP